MSADVYSRIRNIPYLYLVVKPQFYDQYIAGNTLNLHFVGLTKYKKEGMNVWLTKSESLKIFFIVFHLVFLTFSVCLYDVTVYPPHTNRKSATLKCFCGYCKLA